MSSMKGFHVLKHLPEEKVTDKISRRVLVGDQEMIVWWSMKAGAHAAAHRHPHEQMFVMLSGRMEFRLGSEHEAWFHEDTEVIDVFAPPREDFLTPEIPAYMRKG
jgi:quercetin dioxygenase-like cupin family protein